MANRTLYGPRVNYNSSEAQRQQQMAQLLLKQGVDTSPVRGGWGEALARIGTAGIGGYLSNQAGETEKAYAADRAKTLAAALSGQDPNQAANALLANPSTADLGTQLAVGNMTFNRDRAAKKEDFGMERGARLEDLYITQNFQKEMQAMQQAFAAGQQDKALGHATNIAKMQQDFTKGENALNRTAQADLAQKQIDAQQPTRDLTNLLTGQKIQEGKQKLADEAKSKTEAVVSTDRMIRSIDELMGNPEEKLPEHGGFSGAVGAPGVGKLMAMVPGTEGASFKVRLETLKSQAFLPMVAQLKGMGQLSDAEGKKLTAAIGALDTNMSEKEFKASMAEIRNDLVQARNRMGAPSESLAPRPEKPGTPARLKFNPATGELE